MSRYDVNAANVNRQISFLVEPALAADADAAIFGILKGSASAYPHYGQLATEPTALESLAQLRTNLVVQALSRYTIPVGVKLADDSVPTGGLTATSAPALIITFESDEFGAYFNNAWPTDTTLAKHLVSDIVDTVGTGGMQTPKTKPGLQSLLDSLATVSYDNGVTGPFGDLTGGGAIALPDGTTTAGAPTLDNAGVGIAANLSGLKITFIG